MIYFVYAIGKCEHPDSFLNNCYVGVTNNLKNRWSAHKRSNYLVGKTIRKYNLTYENNMVVLFKGTKDECFYVENTLRYEPRIGLNFATGGCGGKTYYSVDRNAKISKKLKGRSTKEWVYKIIANRKKYSGPDNPNAKSWRITSPNGIVYDIGGSIQDFCKSMNINRGVLRKHCGNKVPPIIVGKCGGYRKIDNIKHTVRVNTTGWCLSEMVK